MCGILNVIMKRSVGLDLPRCRRALSKLTRRGPDLSVEFVWNHRLFFGQTILSITGELGKTNGHPLCSFSGRFRLGYNGEIYNHRELVSRWLKDRAEEHEICRTDSYALINLHEVLPCSEIPPLLDGMYAYSLLDTQENTLSICRDVQGEKSLYVYEDEDAVIVSSEIGPILDLKPNIRLDKQTLRDYFHTRHLMLFERTVFSGVRQLQPGHLETLDLNTMKWTAESVESLCDWVDPAAMERCSRRSNESLADELDSIVTDAIHQMIPERPYASVVSGGIDSSLVSRYLTKHSHPDVLVAVNHRGKDRISGDLSGFEKQFDRKIDVIEVDASSYSAEIQRCQRVCGSPLLSHSFVGQSLQSSFVHSAGCRVMFGGDGGDELFGGYPCYLDRRSLNGGFSPSDYTGHSGSEFDFPGDEPNVLRQELANAWDVSFGAYRHIEDPEERIVQAMMFCDFAFQLPSVGMRGTDLMSMMWSVETRSPFLRKPVIQFALNLPARVKSNPGETNRLLRAKPLLKRLFLRHFPEHLLVEKQGFAGFPNESARYLGDIEDYIVLNVLEIAPENIKKDAIGRSTEWKLINLEFFLRDSDQYL